MTHVPIAIDIAASELMFLAPAIFIFLLSLVPIMTKVFRQNREPNAGVTIGWGVIGLIGAVVLAAMTRVHDGQVVILSNSLVMDEFSWMVSVVVGLIGTLTLLQFRDSVFTAHQQLSEIVFLFLNAVVGVLILAWSNDLIVAFIGLELMSLCLYLMIGLSLEGVLSKEAALKYFILGSFGSAIFLYGVSFVYGSVGSTWLPAIHQKAPELISSSQIFLFGVVMIVVGFGFKVALAPFHAWLPDVYEGSPTSLTSFMATVVKLVSFVFLARFFLTGPLLGERYENLVAVLEWLAVLTMFAGNLAAIVQTRLKRMLAYSGVAHSGYAFIAVLALGLGGEGAGVATSSLVYYLVIYSLMTVGAFAALTLFESHYDRVVYLDDLKGLGQRHPWVAFAFATFMLSLAGIPPFAGFFAKFFVFASALDQKLYWVLLWGVVNSVIGVAYYLRPLLLMYMTDSQEAITVRRLSLTNRWIIGGCSAAVVLLGIFNDVLWGSILKSFAQFVP